MTAPNSPLYLPLFPLRLCYAAPNTGRVRVPWQLLVDGAMVGDGIGDEAGHGDG